MMASVVSGGRLMFGSQISQRLFENNFSYKEHLSNAPQV